MRGASEFAIVFAVRVVDKQPAPDIEAARNMNLAVGVDAEGIGE